MTAPADAAAQAFAALLARLEREPGVAAQSYERLRARLIQFFRLHQPAAAEDLADATLDRLGRKLLDGTDIADLPLYALAVARHILLEARGRTARELRLHDDPALLPEPDALAATTRLEHDLAALRACLAELDPAAAALILEYYGQDGQQRIRARQRLADRLGSTLNALRNRALRLRDALERCLRRRLGTDGATEADP